MVRRSLHDVLNASRGPRLAAVAALIVALLAAVAPGTADAGDATIHMVYPHFVPAITTIAIGQSVDWVNNNGITHTSTGDDPLDFWARHDVPTGTDFDLAFAYAGSFSFHCSIHTIMTGTIRVPVQVSPSSGATGDAFTITVRSFVAPAGFDTIIQIKRPGGSWKPWRKINGQSTVFHPQQTGTFHFRSKVERITLGDSPTSGFSPSRAIHVH